MCLPEGMKCYMESGGIQADIISNRVQMHAIPLRFTCCGQSKQFQLVSTLKLRQLAVMTVQQHSVVLTPIELHRKASTPKLKEIQEVVKQGRDTSVASLS